MEVARLAPLLLRLGLGRESRCVKFVDSQYHVEEDECDAADQCIRGKWRNKDFVSPESEPRSAKQAEEHCAYGAICLRGDCGGWCEDGGIHGA